VSAWGFAWSATWLVFYKPQFTSKRIEVAYGNAENADPREEKCQAVIPESDVEYNCRIRRDARLQSGQAGNTNGNANVAVVGPNDGGQVKLATEGVEVYYWVCLMIYHLALSNYGRINADFMIARLSHLSQTADTLGPRSFNQFPWTWMDLGNSNIPIKPSPYRTEVTGPRR